MIASFCVSGLRKKSKHVAADTNPTNKAKALLNFICPVASGLCLVLSTCPSKSLSAMSFITHPADLIRIVPNVKTLVVSPEGTPLEAMTSAARVGKSRSSVPTGLSKRMIIKYGLNKNKSSLAEENYCPRCLVMLR